MTVVRFPRLAAAATAAFALAACGGGDDESAGSTAAAVATTVAATAHATTSITTAAATTALQTVAPVTTAPVAGTTEPGTVPITDAPVGTTVPTLDWQDPTGTFRISFPNEPTAQETQATLPNGTSIPVTAFLSEVAGAAAVAACVESGADLSDVEANLASARDGSLEQFGAELVSDSRSDLQGRPGIEFRGAIGEAGAMQGRAYLDDVRVCSLLVIGEPAIVDGVAGPFLDSFQFVKEAA